MTSQSDRSQIRRNAKGEHRLPAMVATVVAILLYGLLPSDIQPLWLRLPVVVIALVLLASITIINPARASRDSKFFRYASVVLVVGLVAVNLIALVYTVMQLVTTKPGDGPGILAAAAQVWATNLIAFSLLMWELDRGGPVRRRQREREDLPPADFRFPQDEDSSTTREVAEQSSKRSDWRPSYIDYFYEAAVASMAFSPGAAVPVRPRAKLLLVVQSATSFVLVALVIAHAVGALGA